MTEILDANRFGNLTVDRLEAFERHHSFKLPVDYKKFLLKFNGGSPQPSNVRVSQSDVQWIYGIHNGENWASLESHVDTYRNRIPTGTLPIANDSGGNIYLLSLREASYEEIWFWDHENEAEKNAEDYFDNISKCSTSFTDFLNQFHEWVDTDETLEERVIRTNDLDGLRKLLNSGFNLKTLDEFDRNLLEKAVIKNRLEMVQLLLDNGLEIRNAIQLAEQNHHFFPTHGFDKIIQLLKGRQKHKWQFWKK